MLRLVETEGPAALTAERVADAAEVSRRTFFNYYPSVDALIAAGAGALLQRIADALADRPDDEPLADSVIQVVDEVVTLELLSAMVRIWRAVDSSPSASRYALEALVHRTTSVSLTTGPGRSWPGQAWSPTRSASRWSWPPTERRSRKPAGTGSGATRDRSMLRLARSSWPTSNGPSLLSDRSPNRPDGHADQLIPQRP